MCSTVTVARFSRWILCVKTCSLCRSAARCFRTFRINRMKDIYEGSLEHRDVGFHNNIKTVESGNGESFKQNKKQTKDPLLACNPSCLVRWGWRSYSIGWKLQSMDVMGAGSVDCGVTQLVVPKWTLRMGGGKTTPHLGLGVVARRRVLWEGVRLQGFGLFKDWVSCGRSLPGTLWHGLLSKAGLGLVGFFWDRHRCPLPHL